MSERAAVALMGLCIAACLALALSCAAPKPRPFMLTDDAGQCAPGVGPTSPDAVCDGRFTAAGLACVLCAVDAGCLAADVMVHCVPTCAAPECGVGRHR